MSKQDILRTVPMHRNCIKRPRLADTAQCTPEQHIKNSLAISIYTSPLHSHAPSSFLLPSRHWGVMCEPQSTDLVDGAASPPLD